MIFICTLASAMLPSCTSSDKKEQRIAGTAVNARGPNNSHPLPVGPGSRNNSSVKLSATPGNTVPHPHDVSDSQCPNYDTTSLEAKATSELSTNNFVDSMGDFASSAKFRINCMKATSGFFHYKQEAYAAVDSYGIAEALKLGKVGTDNIPQMLAGSKMFASDVIAHGDVPGSVIAQMRKITSDFQGVRN
jgi:hypothetical protein